MAVTLDDLLKANEAKMNEGSAAPAKGVTTEDLIAANEKKMNEGSAAPAKSVTIEDLMKANEEKMAQGKPSVSMKTPSAGKSGMTVFQNFDQSVQDAFQNSKGAQVKESLERFAPTSGGSMAGGSDLLDYNQKLNTKLLTQQKQALEAEREDKISRIDANRLAAQDTIDRESIRALAKQSEDDRARVKEIDQQLKDIEYQLGGGKPSAWERIGKTLRGAGKQYAGSVWDAAGTVMPGGTAVTEVYEEQLENLYDEKARTEAWLKDPEDEQERLQLESRLEAINSQIAVYENSVRANKGVSTAARDAAKELTRSGAQDLERAKLGTGMLGGLLVDAGAAAAQMGGDALLGTLTGSAMVPMMVRSFGSGAQEALEKGYSQEKQVVLGITSAATEYFTEKLFGGNPVYDTDVGLVNRLVSRLTDNDKLISALASAPAEKLYEGLEEIASDILNPIAEYVITGNWDMQGVDEILRDGAVGVIAALAAGGVQKVGETAEKAAQRVSDRMTLPRAGEEMVLPRAGDMENAVPLSEGTAGRPKMSMADFTDNASPVWNNVAYEDTAAQSRITQATHREMVNAGKTVMIPESTISQVGQSYPDLRSLKKTERTPILKQKMSELKSSLRQFLNELKGGSYEFEVNGNILDARLYDTGIKEVMEKITQDKASMLYHSEDVFRNAQYLYSTSDYDGNPNVYRWNYFYTPVQIGDETVGVRIAVRDVKNPVESQIYNWGIKKEAALGGEGRGQNRISPDASSAASSGTALGDGGPGQSPNTTGASSAAPVNTTIAQNAPGVNTAYAEQGGDIQQGYQKKDGGYTGTKHTDKLGIKIAEPIAGLEGAERLVARQQAAYKSKRQLQRKVKELNPTAAEREFAIGLSKGIYTEQDAVVRFGRQIQSMNMDKVRELADYYRAAQSFDVDRIAEKRRENTRNEEAIAESLLKNSDEYKVPSTLSLNANTMKRNVLNIFGRREGTAINARYFDPVTKNSAESIRFINRMYDRVQDFHLSKSESELVQRVMEGSAVADQVSKMSPDLRKRVESVAKSKDKQLSAAEFHLNKEQTEIAERYSQWLDTTARLQDEDVDAGKVTKAAKAYSDAYDDFYAAINDFLVAHGYEPIGFIKGYAPHQQREDVQQGFARVLQRMGIDSNVNELPTEIAGRTADFKPGKQWNPYFQHRKGDAGELDAVSGYESYVNFMANVFYHTDDVQKLRVLSNTLRTKYSNEEISNQISWAKGLRDAPTEVKTNFLIDENRIAPDKVLTKQEADDALEEYISAQFDKIDNMTKYGAFVTALDDYANKLAGKQTKLDRAVEEGLFGRRALNVGNNLSKIFGESTIVGNLSSALNQMAQLPVVQAEVGNKYVLWAMKDILSGEAKRTGFDTESDFITGKLGTESLTGERSWKDSDAKGKRAKVMDAASIPFEAVDNFASRLIVRAKYLRELNEGASHEQAIKTADNFAEKVVGSRMKGAKPMLFESKNIFSKLATTFQLEIANSWAHISKDLRWDIQETAKTQGKAKAVKMAAGIASKYVLEAFLLNRLSETIYGGTPAPFDLLGYIVGGLAAGSGESANTFLVNLVLDVVNKLKGNGGDEDDEEFDVEAALGEAGSLIVGDMPYVRNIASMLGYGDSSLPLPKLPTKTVKSLWDMIHGQEGAGQDLAYNAVNELTDWLPMGNQAQKTIQGIQSVARGGRYNGDKLMYPMDTSGVLGKLRAAKAILFGNSSMSAADDYYAGGAKPLSEKQTAAYEQIVGSGEDQQTVYDTMKAVRGVKDVPDSTEDNKQKRAIIRDAQISDLSKAAIYSAMISESRDEDFAAMLDAGVSFSEIMDVYDTYENISDMDLSKTQMATEFAKEMDLRYNKDVADMYKEYFLYWINMPAEAKSYDKFSAEGFGAEKSAELSGIVSEISGQSAEEKRASLRDMEISDGDKARVYYVYLASDSEAEFLDGLSEKGYGTVQAYQLLMQMKDNEVSIKEYQKLADAGLKNDEYIISVAKATADDNLSNWRAVVNQAEDDDTALKTLSAYMTESQYAKAEIAIGQYSISPAAYVTVQEEIAKPGYEGKVNQEVVKDAIDHVAGLSNTERAVLWQLANKSWSAKNNPYDKNAAAQFKKDMGWD